jgi:hypothetical protein
MQIIQILYALVSIKDFICNIEQGDLIMSWYSGTFEELCRLCEYVILLRFTQVYAAVLHVACTGVFSGVSASSYTCLSL